MQTPRANVTIPRSEIDVKPRRRNEDRTAISVVTRVADGLKIDGKIHAAPEGGGVIPLDDAFRPEAEGAVAKKEPQPAGGEIVAVHVRESVLYRCDPDLVEGAMLEWTKIQTHRGCSVD